MVTKGSRSLLTILVRIVRRKIFHKRSFTYLYLLLLIHQILYLNQFFLPAEVEMVTMGSRNLLISDSAEDIKKRLQQLNSLRKNRHFCDVVLQVRTGKYFGYFIFKIFYYFIFMYRNIQRNTSCCRYILRNILDNILFLKYFINLYLCIEIYKEIRRVAGRTRSHQLFISPIQYLSYQNYYVAVGKLL